MLKKYPLAKAVGHLLLALGGPFGPPEVVDTARVWNEFHDAYLGYADYPSFQAACTEKLGEVSVCLVISRAEAYLLICNDLECVPIE